MSKVSAHKFNTERAQARHEALMGRLTYLDEADAKRAELGIKGLEAKTRRLAPLIGAVSRDLLSTQDRIFGAQFPDGSSVTLHAIPENKIPRLRGRRMRPNEVAAILNAEIPDYLATKSAPNYEAAPEVAQLPVDALVEDGYISEGTAKAIEPSDLVLAFRHRSAVSDEALNQLNIPPQ